MNMGITELFTLIDDNITDYLSGEINLVDGEEIKWSYDGLGSDYLSMDDHLREVYDSDLEIIEDFIIEKNQEGLFSLLPPDIDDTIISFVIVEL